MADENGADTGAGAAAASAGGGEGGAAAGSGVSAALFGGSAVDAGGGAGAASGGEGGAAAAAGAESGGAGSAEFLGQFSAEGAAEGDKSNRDWIAAKGFKDIDGLVSAHRNAERALHDSGRVKIPGEGATAEEVKAFHTAIGVPDDVKGYVVAPPKDGAGKDIALNAPLVDRLAADLHAKGVPMPAKAFEAAVQAFAKIQMDEAATIDREQMGKAAAIAKSWGDGKAEKMAALDRAVDALQLTHAEVTAMRNTMGADRFIDRMLVLGQGLSESKLFGGDSQTKFGISEQEAQARKDVLVKTDGFAKKAQVKGSPENIEWERLNTILGEAANRKAREAA